jgi:hypothetical protein
MQPGVPPYRRQAATSAIADRADRGAGQPDDTAMRRPTGRQRPSQTTHLLRRMMASEKLPSGQTLVDALPAPTSATPAGPPRDSARRRRLLPALGLLALLGGASHLLSSPALILRSALTTTAASPHDSLDDGFLSGPIEPAGHQSTCRQASIAPVPANETGRGDVFYTDAFAAKEAERFLGAIRIPTEIVCTSLCFWIRCWQTSS